MIRISIVKSARNYEDQKYDEYNLPHGTNVMKGIVMSWAKTDRVICADSYFASVPHAE